MKKNKYLTVVNKQMTGSIYKEGIFSKGTCLKTLTEYHPCYSMLYDICSIHGINGIAKDLFVWMALLADKNMSYYTFFKKEEREIFCRTRGLKKKSSGKPSLMSLNYQVGLLVKSGLIKKMGTNVYSINISNEILHRLNDYLSDTCSMKITYSKNGKVNIDVC